MRSIHKLFGRSPFGPLQEHMEAVATCVQGVTELFDAFKAGQSQRVEELAKEISKREHQADQVKNDIRNHLPRSLFMPVDRVDLLEILGIQDSIADRAEDLAILCTLKPDLTLPEPLRDLFDRFLQQNLTTYQTVRKILAELDELLESSFGGPEAEKVKSLVDQAAFEEHEADVLQRELVKGLLAHEDAFSKGEFHVWMRLLEGLAAISNLSEKLANRVRMTLERK